MTCGHSSATGDMTPSDEFCEAELLSVLLEPGVSSATSAESSGVFGVLVNSSSKFKLLMVLLSASSLSVVSLSLMEGT
jgi:hypothetical protein